GGVDRDRLGCSREHHGAVGGDCHRVFEVGRKRAVGGPHGPAVGVDLGVTGPDVEHRLDAEGHSHPQLQALAPFAVVGHLGLLVHRPPDPVTDVLLDHPVTVGAAHLVDGGTDVTEPAALSDLADAGPHALLGD